MDKLIVVIGGIDVLNVFCVFEVGVDVVVVILVICFVLDFEKVCCNFFLVFDFGCFV